MLLHLVVVLSLSWTDVTGKENTYGVQDEAALDQMATASENVARSVMEQAEQEEKKFRDQLITSMIDTSVRYENSNGFVPMLVSPSPPASTPPPESNGASIPPGTSNLTWISSPSQRDSNSSAIASDEGETRSTEPKRIEDDPPYTTEAGIFLNFPSLNSNRRSFDYQRNRNDFELLKVGNDTPIVATYPDFYEESSTASEPEDSRAEFAANHRAHRKGQTVEDYMGNYGTGAAENDQAFYPRHYSRDSSKDKEKSNRQPEKVAEVYRQQSVPDYEDPERSESKQNGRRSNEEIDARRRSTAKNYDQPYDSTASASRVSPEHGFSGPVVVAEPSYKYDESSDPAADDYRTSRIIDSASSEVSRGFHRTIDNRNGRFRSDEDSGDVSDDSDYLEYTERPRRQQKSRRRPSDGSKRLPKEHRASQDDSREYEGQGKRQHSSRSKSNRQRSRGNSWMDEGGHREHEDSYEDTRYDGRLSGSETRYAKNSQQNSKFKQSSSSSSWNQVSPNLEISHSSGIEIGQLEKPKLIVPVKVNLVPVANFDHATAIGSSQGFDVSDAVLRNGLLQAAPLGTPSTMMNAAENAIGGKPRLSTPVPDIIVGQNSFQNSLQAMYSQLNEKFPSNWKPRYVSSTVPPFFAVTPSFDSGLQGMSIQDVQATATPRPTYSGPSNHPSQFIVPQPTVQTVPALMQTPIANPDYVQVNPHGMHGQNPVDHGGLQVQPFATTPAIASTPQPVPVTRFNLLPSESTQSKKILLPAASGGNLFASAAGPGVGQNDQRQAVNGNSYYLQNSRPQIQNGWQVSKSPSAASRTKTFIQTTHLLPAVLQPLPTLATVSASTPQMFAEQQNVQGTSLFVQATRDEPSQQQQQQQQQQYASIQKNERNPSLAYQPMNNAAGHGDGTVNANASPTVSGIIENAHLPHVATRNVEIVNPNIRPSPLDTAIINSYEAMHYPAAIFTTSIPMFATTSFVTARPAVVSATTASSNVPNSVDSFPDTGAKNNQPRGNDIGTYHSQDGAAFDPIDFVPNADVLKNQNALNSKLRVSEALQQNLNLVPLLPGGNFFKPGLSAQSELASKPKLSSDLETYAEQMFKESLRTIYNSQKWNNDRKAGNARPNVSDVSDIAKLRSELQRLKASLYDFKRSRDQLEGHQSETKLQTAEAPGKKPDELLAALEQMLKDHSSDPPPSFHGSGNNKPARHRRPGDSDKHPGGSGSDFKHDSRHIRDFLTPPQLNAHRAKGHPHDKPAKKRPGPLRYRNHNHYHGPRPHHRSNMSPKMGGIETSASNLEPIHLAGYSRFENSPDSNLFKKAASFDPYSPFAGPSSADKNSFLQAVRNHKGFEDKENVYDHPKVHNLFGLLMKNKQLPQGGAPRRSRDKDRPKQHFEDEKQHGGHRQFYQEALKDYFGKMSDGMLYSNLGYADSDTRRSLPGNRVP